MLCFQHEWRPRTELHLPAKYFYFERNASGQASASIETRSLSERTHQPCSVLDVSSFRKTGRCIVLPHDALNSAYEPCVVRDFHEKLHQTQATVKVSQMLEKRAISRRSILRRNSFFNQSAIVNDWRLSDDKGRTTWRESEQKMGSA